MNTRQFCEKLPNVIHLKGVTSLVEKANFINACDAMIHARSRGESFGLAVAEYLYFGKSVFSWCGGTDQNHVLMLEDRGNFYSDEEDSYRKIMEFNPKFVNKQALKDLVSQFTPEIVMKRFKEVFLET